MTKNGINDGKCAMCGKALRHGYTVIEEIDRSPVAFDSKDCAIIFKRFRSVYGTDFLTNFG